MENKEKNFVDESFIGLALCGVVNRKVLHIHSNGDAELIVLCKHFIDVGDIGRCGITGGDCARDYVPDGGVNDLYSSN